MPPVTITSWSPARIIVSAISTARIDDAQTLLIVSDADLLRNARPDRRLPGRRLARHPAWSTSPMITYSTSFGSTPARSSAALIAIAPELRRLVAGEAAAELPERRSGGGDDD